jgi:sulfur carrier protein
MRVMINGEAQDVGAVSLAALLEQLGYTGACVATAVNGEFAPASMRGETLVQDGDDIEIVGPMQGG